MSIAFTLARRELRGGVRGLWIVVLCLALGVGAIAAVGSLRSAVEAGLASDGRALLGGDLEVDTGSETVPADLLAWLAEHDARVSEVAQMRSMLAVIDPEGQVAGRPSGQRSGQRQLIELKAVDSAWPLVSETARGDAHGGPIGDATGGLGIDPPMTLQAAFADHGILIDRLILDRLGLAIGDRVRIGSATFRVAGVLTREPDRIATGAAFGPRVLMAMDDLAATGLLMPGAMVRHAVRLTAPAAPTMARQLAERFPSRGWRIRDPRDAAPGVTRFIDQIALFLTLVGLTSLLVGGIGVANGVRAWLDARARTIAILRCLGASAGLVFAVCLIQVMALASLGIMAGVGLGGLLPVVAGRLLSGLLPVAPVFGFYPAPLVLAAAFGVLIALSFALWPLARAARIPGGALFRDALIPEGTRPSWPLALANLALVAALIGLTVLAAGDRRFALYFCAAALLTLILFRAGGWLVMLVARLAAGLGSPAMRLGIANLHRPGAPTPLLLLSAGLGLSTLAAVALIQGNMGVQIADQLPAKAPSFFFIDIQNEQVAAFQRIVEAQPGPVEVRDVPSLRARVVALKGVPVEQARVSPDSAWALRGDRGLTYAAAEPEGARIVSGAWWPAGYDGKPLVSLDATLAKGWGVGVGDVVRVNVLGRDLDLTIANVREIDWRSLGINFFMVASPGILSRAPHTHIATVKLPEDQEAALLRAVTDALPNVTGIRVRDVLGAVADILNQVAMALSVTGGVTLLAGSLVLVGAVAAGQRRRIREAVILKTLGATRRQIRAAWLTEFGILGLVAGLIAAAVGSAASFGVMHYILHTYWIFLPRTLICTITGALAIMLVFGYTTVSAALRAPPAPLLRNE